MEKCTAVLRLQEEGRCVGYESYELLDGSLLILQLATFDATGTLRHHIKKAHSIQVRSVVQIHLVSSSELIQNRLKAKAKEEIQRQRRF